MHNYDPKPDLGPGLQALRQQGGAGFLSQDTCFQPGVGLHADPGLRLRGNWSSPAGRILELSATVLGKGDWVGLHVKVDLPDISLFNWFGFMCRSVAPKPIMIRACLRSGTETGFRDDFFPQHILAHDTPQSHVDVLHLATMRPVPIRSPWRELILFLPCETFTFHLHDFDVFAA